MEQSNIPPNTPWLTPWQRRAIIVVGAVAGAIAAAAVIRWLSCRRAAREAAAKPTNGRES